MNTTAPWAPPSPPAPPKRHFWRGLGIAALVVIAVSAVLALVVPDDEPESVGTREPAVLDADSAEDPVRLTEFENDRPDWASDPAVREHALYMESFIRIVTEQGEHFTLLVESGLYSDATDTSIDIWKFYRDAQPAPHNAPYRDEWDRFVMLGEEAFDLISDGMIYEDPALIDQGTLVLVDLTVATGDLTQAIYDATQEIE